MSREDSQVRLKSLEQVIQLGQRIVSEDNHLKEQRLKSAHKVAGHALGVGHGNSHMANGHSAGNRFGVYGSKTPPATSPNQPPPFMNQVYISAT